MTTNTPKASPSKTISTSNAPPFKNFKKKKLKKKKNTHRAKRGLLINSISVVQYKR